MWFSASNRAETLPSYSSIKLYGSEVGSTGSSVKDMTQMRKIEFKISTVTFFFFFLIL